MRAFSGCTNFSSYFIAIFRVDYGMLRRDLSYFGGGLMVGASSVVLVHDELDVHLVYG